MYQLTSLVVIFQVLFRIAHSSDLFEFEKVQLQDSTLPLHSRKDASLLRFYSTRDQLVTNTTCKVFPGDASWPSDAQWALLNSTTNGTLIRTVPLASPCYPGPLSNADQCSFITAQWTNSTLHMVDPTSPMSPIWQGRTCEPPLIAPSPNGTCTLGGLPSYSINATTVAQIQAGINFARNTGIRLVIKNTGHDFSGKSSGAGSLNIWTHYLKDVEFIPDFTDASYKGPAFKAGTGVQAWEIYQAAEKYGVTVVGGEGKTVGVMGGYIQGGGHSPLSSIYGIAADNILSMNIVLASGEFITASPTNNTSLFWALRGGGGSTFGVVTSITIKVHPALPVTTTSFAFGGSGSNITDTTFWSAVRSYFTHFPTFVDAGTYGYFFVFPSPPGSPPSFALSPFFAPNLTVSQTQTLLTPFLNELAALGINPNITYNHYPTFYPAWSSSFPLEGVGRDNSLFGSRLFPRSNFLSPNSTLFNATFEAWKGSITAGYGAISFHIGGKLHPSNSANAVNPAWRETVMHSIQAVSWTAQGNLSTLLQAGEDARKTLDERMKAWKDVTPGAGAYLGESDRGETGWQESFYGKETYPSLLAIKQIVDPGQLFWAKTAVGSEGWDVVSVTGSGIPDENGRLCRV